MLPLPTLSKGSSLRGIGGYSLTLGRKRRITASSAVLPAMQHCNGGRIPVMSWCTGNVCCEQACHTTKCCHGRHCLIHLTSGWPRTKGSLHMVLCKGRMRSPECSSERLPAFSTPCFSSEACFRPLCPFAVRPSRWGRASGFPVLLQDCFLLPL